MSDGARTIRRLVDQWADQAPQAPFLIAPETGAVMTYAKLQEHCRELARVLLMNGLSPGDTVSLMMPNPACRSGRPAWDNRTAMGAPSRKSPRTVFPGGVVGDARMCHAGCATRQAGRPSYPRHVVRDGCAALL